MCTFKITSCTGALEVDKYLKLGGPDSTQTVHLGDILFQHNLLSLTGEFTPQPIRRYPMLFMLLGEVYNYDRKFPSDIYYAIEMFIEHGNDFTKYLDGEFLFIAYNEITQQIDFFSDPWGTRQVWYEENKHFYFGTIPLAPARYYSRETENPELHEQDIRRLKGNSHYRYDVNNRKLELINAELHKWDLKQHKTTYDDWNVEFERAVIKRYHKKSVLALSGGVDSVSIALCLDKYRLPINSIHVATNPKAEDLQTYSETIRATSKTNVPVMITKTDYTENERLSRDGLQTQTMRYICEKVVSMDKRVLIVGHGADETISNYMSKTLHSEPNISPFEDDLTSMFPWKHFYGGMNRFLLDKNESIALSYGVEVRNVFLDKRLVQEWLWLSADLKNSEIKGPLKNYLRNRNISLPKKQAALRYQEW